MGVALSGAAALGGCSSGGAGPTAAASQTPPPPSATAPSEAAALPPITVEQTGGFAGVRNTVTITPQGAWTATTGAGGQNTGQLSAPQMAGISALAADPRLPTEAQQTRGASRCNDAFTYTLTVGTARVSYVQCPADPDQPAASDALVREVMQVTAPMRG